MMHPVVPAVGTMALLMLLQVLVADFVGIRNRHVPGSGLSGGHEDAFFRVARTVANTNETIAIFLLAALFCVWAGASESATAWAAWAYVGARGAYAVCYYCNLQTLRSTCFVISLLALLALLVIGFRA